MRRTDRELGRGDGIEFLKRARWGVLSTGDGARTMSVPVSFGLDGEGRLYFHGASQGRKAGLLRTGTDCTFVAVASDQPVVEELSHLYESVILEGVLEKLEGAEALEGLRTIVRHYGQEPASTADVARQYMDKGAVFVWRFVPRSLTAKACRKP